MKNHRNRTNPSQMSQLDIVSQIRVLRASIDTDARRIFELSQSLYRTTRRQPVDDSTAPYINYANVWTRFASMVGLGLRRNASSERALTMLNQDPEIDSKPNPKPEVFKSTEDDDFDVVYGEVLNA